MMNKLYLYMKPAKKNPKQNKKNPATKVNTPLTGIPSSSGI